MEHCHTSASAKSDALAAIEARPKLSELSWPVLFTRAKPVEQTAREASSPMLIATLEHVISQRSIRPMLGLMHGLSAAMAEAPLRSILPQYRRTAARMPEHTPRGRWTANFESAAMLSICVRSREVDI